MSIFAFSALGFLLVAVLLENSKEIGFSIIDFLFGIFSLFLSILTGV